ncbi:FMN-linked oxidoreductase [Xylariomycetidae sp. FL2044]|nr:FMN-linked oxidoreductase [Xylariomycetidae sp. FL2044]
MATEKVAQADQAPVVSEPCSTERNLVNHGAPDVPFYTPIQQPPAGTSWDIQPAGSLFSPLKINGMEIHNRIIVSPMCQSDGYMTMWHHVHLGSFAVRGPGLVLTEVISVSPEGRISPQDLGLWDDGHIGPLKQIVDFAHSQGVKFGVQMGHAGRKASTVAPWIDRKAAARDSSDGWPNNVIAPTAEAYSKDTVVPREATKEDIEKFKKDWVAAVRRALKAGVDVIEIHAAHGYLLNQFLSPASNKRTDEYGGSFANRTRLLLEVVDLLKADVAPGYPVMARIPSTDYLENEPTTPQWALDDGIELARVLAARGVDFLDITGGGLDARQKIAVAPGYKVPHAEAIKRALAGTGTLVGTGGEVTSGSQAAAYLEAGSVDAVIIGRPFLKDPSLVWHWADEVETDIHVPSQYGWGFGMTRTHRKRSKK